VMEPMESRELSNKRAIYASLAGNAGIALAKFVAAAFTGSTAMLSEGIHSLVDTSNQALLLLGWQQAKQPADERFPYGQGKAVYFWGLIAIIVFTLGGFYSLYLGFQNILQPRPIEHAWLNYGILAIALVLEFLAWRVGVREFRQIKGQASFLDAVRNAKDPSIAILIFENSADMMGIVVAFLGILLSQVTGILYFDGAASMIIGLILVAAALWLAHEVKNLLIGESADLELVQGIRTLVDVYPDVCEIEEITTLHMGPEYVLVNMRVKFVEITSADDIEQATHDLEEQIQNLFPLAKQVYVKPAVRPGARQQRPRLINQRVGVE